MSYTVIDWHWRDISYLFYIFSRFVAFLVWCHGNGCSRRKQWKIWLFYSLFTAFSHSLVWETWIYCITHFLPDLRDILVFVQVVRYLYSVDSVFWLLFLGRTAIPNKSRAVWALLLNNNLISSPLHSGSSMVWSDPGHHPHIQIPPHQYNSGSERRKFLKK